LKNLLERRLKGDEFESQHEFELTIYGEQRLGHLGWQDRHQANDDDFLRQD
jgi:hypothetical protein